MKKLIVVAFLLAVFLVGCVNAQGFHLTWDAYLPIQLVGDSYVQSSQPWVFSSFSFGTNSLLLRDTYISAGTPITSFNITSSDANVTLNQLALSGTTALTISSGADSSVLLIGFGQAPDSVTINGTQTTLWSYSTSQDVLTLAPIPGVQNVILDYSSSGTNDAFAMAIVALIVGVSFGSMALVFALRRRSDE